MKRISKFIYLFFIPLLVLGCGAKKENTTKKSPQTPGDYVENAAFTNFKGDTVHVSDFKGKVVMIDFWETWCKPCIGSFPTLEKLTKEYPDNLVILAVTPGFTDTPKDAKKFASDHDYTFRYLLDTSNLHKKLNVQGIPFKVFVDADGNFVGTKMGSAGPKGDYDHIKEMVEKYKKSALSQTGNSNAVSSH